MSDYLLINIATIFFPLILTFEKKLKFYRNLPALFISIVTVGLLFIAWDIIATARGDWSFNEEHILGVYIFNLPLEEILFFITVPYSIIFLYETAKFYLGDKEITYYCNLYTYAALFFSVASLAFVGQYYTLTIMLFVGLFFVTAKLLNPSLLKSRLYWRFIAFTFIPFFIVNYFLTSIPIVLYNDSAIWGTRIITIPVEDFFYSFSLLSFNLLIYVTVKEKWLIKK